VLVQVSGIVTKGSEVCLCVFAYMYVDIQSAVENDAGE